MKSCYNNGEWLMILLIPCFYLDRSSQLKFTNEASWLKYPICPSPHSQFPAGPSSHLPHSLTSFFCSYLFNPLSPISAAVICTGMDGALEIRQCSPH